MKHIDLKRLDGTVKLVIDDYELFDFVDDFMVEHDVEYDYMTEENRDGQKYFTMHFTEDVSAELISGILAEIPKEEIERIWALNNN